MQERIDLTPAGEEVLRLKGEAEKLSKELEIQLNRTEAAKARWKDEVERLSKERDELREAIKRRPSSAEYGKMVHELAEHKQAIEAATEDYKALQDALEIQINRTEAAKARVQRQLSATSEALDAERLNAFRRNARLAQVRSDRNKMIDQVREARELAQEAAVFISDLPSPSIDKQDLLRRLVNFGGAK